MMNLSGSSCGCNDSCPTAMLDIISDDMQNAVRRYYEFIKKKEFPQLKDYR